MVPILRTTEKLVHLRYTGINETKKEDGNRSSCAECDQKNWQLRQVMTELYKKKNDREEKLLAENLSRTRKKFSLVK